MADFYEMDFMEGIVILVKVDEMYNNCMFLSCPVWPVWPNGWLFVYELSGSGFESSCSHLKCAIS